MICCCYFAHFYAVCQTHCFYMSQLRCFELLSHV
jgi:hypothetical protein